MAKAFHATWTPELDGGRLKGPRLATVVVGNQGDLGFGNVVLGRQL